MREPVVHIFQSSCHTSSREDLALALSSVGDQANSVGKLLTFWVASLANSMTIVDPSVEACDIKFRIILKNKV